MNQYTVTYFDKAKDDTFWIAVSGKSSEEAVKKVQKMGHDIIIKVEKE